MHHKGQGCPKTHRRSSVRPLPPHRDSRPSGQPAGPVLSPHLPDTEFHIIDKGRPHLIMGNGPHPIAHHLPKGCPLARFSQIEAALAQLPMRIRQPQRGVQNSGQPVRALFLQNIVRVLALRRTWPDRTERPGSSRGSRRNTARPAALRPAVSPSKQRTGSSCSFQASCICCSVSAVPSGASAPATPLRVSDHIHIAFHQHQGQASPHFRTRLIQP